MAVEVERRRRLEAELRESQRLLSLVEVAAVSDYVDIRYYSDIILKLFLNYS